MISIAFLMATASVAEQLAPSHQGKLQCQMPDISSKTCMSLSKIFRTGPSSYLFETRMLIDANGPAIATVRTTVEVKGLEICDRVDLGDLSRASWTVSGKPISATNAEPYLAIAHKRLAPFAGRELCTQIVPGGDGMLKVVTRIDGKRLPKFDLPIMWVDNSEGWEVSY